MFSSMECDDIYHGTMLASQSRDAAEAHSAPMASSTPRLGDFSKIQSDALQPPSTTASPLSSLSNHDTQPAKFASQRDAKPDKNLVTLGNFFKIFQELERGPSPPSSPAPPSNLARRRSSARASQQVIDVLAKLNIDLGTDKESQSESDFDGSPGSPPTTPPSSLDREPLYLAALPKKERAAYFESPSTPSHIYVSPKSPMFYFQNAKYGPVTAVYDNFRTIDQKHLSLQAMLIPVRADDEFLNARHPGVVSNGIHVFLDMSNINISFQETLRRRYSLSKTARFKPLPVLNLPFLTELLVRGRDTRVLNVGCSVQPGHHDPPYIRELRNLGYRVDLRERKRIEEAARGHRTSGASSSDEFHASKHARYVEDLVDETLQTRIGESVMECFQEQGTLVMATGDAQPAKYSDGFFTYAERALRMGWNVEVISWKSSLSSNWRNPAWADQWGKRFRVIELDDFLDDLLM